MSVATSDAEAPAASAEAQAVDAGVQPADAGMQPAAGGDVPAGGDGQASGADGSGQQQTSEARPQEFDLEALLGDEERRQAILQHEAMQSVLRDRENAGAQRREAQLKREAGRNENVRAMSERFLREFGIDPTSLDDQKKQRLNLLSESALSFQAREFVDQVPKALLNRDLPVEVREKAIEAREQGDWDGYVSTLLTGAVEAATSERVGAVKLADIPAGAPLHAEVQKAIADGVAAELKAQQKAENLPDVPPRTPGGAPGGTQKHDLNTRLGVLRAVNAGQISESDGRDLLGKLR